MIHLQRSNMVNSGKNLKWNRSNSKESKGVIITHKFNSNSISPPHQLKHQTNLLVQKGPFNNTKLSPINKMQLRSLEKPKVQFVFQQNSKLVNLNKSNTNNTRYAEVNYSKYFPDEKKFGDTELKHKKVSPNMQILRPQLKNTNKQVQDLRRKCKILDTRIHELYCQNNDTFLKLNKENRELYHEKQDLLKQLTLMKEQIKVKNQQIKEKHFQSILEISKNKDHEEVTEQLFIGQGDQFINQEQSKKNKQRIEDLQLMITEEIKNKVKLTELNDKLIKKNNQNQNQVKQNAVIISNLNAKIQELEIKIELFVAEQQKESLRIKQYEDIIGSIKRQINQSYQRNQQIINQYEVKLKQANKQVEQLQTMNMNLNESKQQTKQILQNQVSMKYDTDYYEQKIQQLQHEILNSENQKKKLVIQLQFKLEQHKQQEIQMKTILKTNQQLQIQLKTSQQTIGQLQTMIAIDKYKVINDENEQKYLQCKKCQQLLKTIFKLNQNLNK